MKQKLDFEYPILLFIELEEDIITTSDFSICIGEGEDPEVTGE